MTLPQPVIAQSRADAVVENLINFIASEALAVGDRLPAERELANALGVSRPILREALKHLAALGIVETRTGSGSYLTDDVSPHDQRFVMKLESERQSLVKLLQLRRALESEAAALTALKATPPEISELELLVDRLELEHVQHGFAPEADKAFHLALYRFSGNPLFSQIINPIWETIERLKVRPSKNVDVKTLGLHRKTLEHIRSRDPERARQTILDLLHQVEHDLIQTSAINTKEVI
ncbi:MAG: FadR family transcriptional regulator [Trueperaceae bacterium]|nr:FadR family transcriptional regulator [Trueperaceae bacterium]